MREANEAIERERHPTPTIDDIIHDLNGAKHFSKLDLVKGYHQLELSDESKYITTFSTHIGLYRYKRLNFGIKSAAEIFQYEIQKLIQGIPGVLNVSDDILIYGKEQLDHDKALTKTLNRLKDAGLTLNQNKCKFNKTQLKFFGHLFSNKGILPDEEKIIAIQEMKQPTSQTEMRSFLGMTNFCAKFVPNLATITKPLRDLTKKNCTWIWTTQHQTAFNTVKQQLATATNLAYFDKNKATEIWTDAGPNGLGAMLIQRSLNGEAHILAYASHALNNTEMRYSQIEKEALALTWATQHFHLYVYGNTFTIVTDHKPLIYIYNNTKAILSTRLERWRLKLQMYDFKVEYKPGKHNPADYLSRHPIKQNHMDRNSHLAEEYTNFIVEHTTPKNMSIEEVQTHTKNDPILQQIIKSLHTNIWTSDLDNADKKQFQALCKIKFELSTDVQGTVLLHGTRLVLPSSLQDKAIQIAHSSHLGICKTKALLREKIWFIGLDKAVERTIRTCLPCQSVTNTHQQPPLVLSETPSGPWQIVNVDHKGPLPSGDYLLIVIDQYSKFPVAEIVSSTAAKSNIQKLDNIFATFGIPHMVITDNGPPFNGHEFSGFAIENGFKHKKITPMWPRANGEVERFNRTINKILSISHQFNSDWKKQINNLLLDYRTPPHSTTNITPAELLFGHSISNRLPDAKQLTTSVDQETIEKNERKIKQKAMEHYGATQSLIKKMPQIGDTVLIKQNKRSKFNTPFNPNPYRVTKVKGSMISARRNEHVTRNASFCKVIPQQDDEVTRNASFYKVIPQQDDDKIAKSNQQKPSEKLMENIQTELGINTDETSFSEEVEHQKSDGQAVNVKENGTLQKQICQKSTEETEKSRTTPVKRYYLRDNIKRPVKLIEE